MPVLSAFCKYFPAFFIVFWVIGFLFGYPTSRSL
jgi:hypothetical protein